MMHFADCVSREHVTDICRRCCLISVSGRTHPSSRYFYRWKINVHYSKTSKVKQKSIYTKSSMDHWFSKYFVSSLVELLCCLRTNKSLTCSWVFDGSATSCTKQESIPVGCVPPICTNRRCASIATRYQHWGEGNKFENKFEKSDVPCPGGSPYIAGPMSSWGSMYSKVQSIMRTGHMVLLYNCENITFGWRAGGKYFSISCISDGYHDLHVFDWRRILPDEQHGFR